MHLTKAKYPLLFSGLLVALVSVALFAFSPKASATYDGGRLIDDMVLLNANTMSEPDIHNFIVNKGGGLANMSFVFDCASTGMSAQYYQAAGAPCGQTVRAATIIYYAAQIYGVNPQVILATMQKEQSVVTDPNPASWQVNQAMGYGCPDSGGCGASNFLYQIDNGVWTLRFHMERARGNMDYWFHSTSWVCGTAKNYYSPSLYPGQDVNFYDDNGTLYRTHYIANPSTSSFYCYTPHAYNNPQGLYGLPAYGTTGQYYSGSYNFVTYFERWFGTTLSGVAPLPITSMTLDTTEATVGQTVTATYKITNPFNFSLTLPTVGVNNRLGDTVLDFGIEQNVTFSANETKTFIANFTPNAPGAYRMQGVYNYFAGWYGGTYSWLNVHTPSLSLTSTTSINPQYPLINTPYSTSFTIKNTGGLTAYLTNLMQANMDGTVPRGYKAVTISITPGQSYTYSDTRTLTNTNQQTAWVAYQLGNGWYRIGDNKQYRAYSTPANLVLIAPITTSPVYPVIGTPTSAKFKIKNTGDQPVWLSNLGLGVQRVSDGQRFDYTSQAVGIPGLISGGQEYEFNASRVLPTKDTYSLFLTGSYDGTNFTSDLINSSSIPKTINVAVYSSPAKLEITQPIQTQQSAGPMSHIVDLQYGVKNSGDAPTGDIYLAFYCRQNSTIYCDIPMSSTNLSGGQSTTVTKSLAYFSPGTYMFKPLKYMNGLWQDFDSGTTVNIFNTVPSKATFSTTLSLDQSNVTVGTPVQATYTIKNTSAYDLQLPVYAVASRLNGAFYDFGLQNWFYVRAGETKSFTSTFTPTKAGTYTLFPVLRTANDSWYGYQEQSLTVH